MGEMRVIIVERVADCAVDESGCPGRNLVLAAEDAGAFPACFLQNEFADDLAQILLRASAATHDPVKHRKCRVMPGGGRDRLGGHRGQGNEMVNAGHQYDFGRPSTRSAMKHKIRLVDMGAT